MRDIKFRAWQPGRKRMVDVAQINFANEETRDELSIGWVDEIIKNDIGKEIKYAYSDRYNREPVILLQWTGLKDKNGVEIYEGDILEVTDDDFNFELYLINMRDGISYPFYGDVLLGKKKIEIIGNIYENPELLEEK